MALSLTRSPVELIGTLLFDFSEDDNASTILTADDLEGFDSILIVSPQSNPVGATITLNAIEDKAVDETDDASWRPVHSPSGTAITIPNGASVPVTELPFFAIRLESDGTETADRAYNVLGVRKT